MSDPSSLADDLEREVKQTARANLAAYEAEAGLDMNDEHREAFDLGVGHGFLATLQVLIRHGILPSTPTEETR